MDRMSAIARSVLYEGYMLWPYTRSARKNRQRWTFGAVFPRRWSAAHPDDASLLRSEVLIEGDAGTSVAATARFLQVVDRRLRDGHGAWVQELVVGGERQLAWEEARERELCLAPCTLGELVDGRQIDLRVPAASDEEPLTDRADGHGGPAVVRSWSSLQGSFALRAQRLSARLYRVSATVCNETCWSGEERRQALRHALISTHIAWRAQEGCFVSLADPPEALREHARACANIGSWPVLAGDEGDRSLMLSAPIILEDHPRIAPESPGDMFDGGEIDQLLVLNILALSDAEKQEMRDSDPRAREILERCSAMGAPELMGLHGTIRELRPWS